MNLLIVCYHYFREETYTGGIYPVNRQTLVRQAEEISKHYRFISQSELAELINTGKTGETGNYCLMTFDDGLKEQMHAFRLLKSMDIPSVFYVSSAVRTGIPMVHEVHKLHQVRTKLGDEDIAILLDQSFGWSSFDFDEEILSRQYPFDTPLSRKVKYFVNFVMPPESKSRLTDELFSRLVNDEQGFSREFYMNEEEIKELATNDALGAHGHSHTPLATMTQAKAQQDVITCVRYLENLTGMGVKSFAYPYGGPTAIPQDATAVFKDTAVSFAVTTISGMNTEKTIQKNGRFYLHRVDTNDAPGGKKMSQDFFPSTNKLESK